MNNEEKTYTVKEDARMALEQSLREYKSAADSYGHGPSDIASEIEDCCFSAGINVTVIHE